MPAKPKMANAFANLRRRLEWGGGATGIGAPCAGNIKPNPAGATPPPSTRSARQSGREAEHLPRLFKTCVQPDAITTLFLARSRIAKRCGSGRAERPAAHAKSLIAPTTEDTARRRSVAGAPAWSTYKRGLVVCVAIATGLSLALRRRAPSPSTATSSSPSPAASPHSPCPATPWRRSRSPSPGKVGPLPAQSPRRFARSRSPSTETATSTPPACRSATPPRSKAPPPPRPLLPAETPWSAPAPTPPWPPSPNRRPSPPRADPRLQRPKRRPPGDPRPHLRHRSRPRRQRHHLLHPAPHGAYGTQLTDNLPAALNHYGYVKRIALTLHRTYTYRGRRHSYLCAACAAPAGFPGATSTLLAPR